MGVTESDVAVPSPVTLTEAAGAPLTDVAVGTFTDPGNPTQTAADWTATIDWGDGTTTPGTVSGPDAGGVFSVMGSHSYAAPAPATEPIIVTVTDDRPGTLSFPIFSTADLLAPTPTQPTITMPVGSPFGGSVATFPTPTLPTRQPPSPRRSTGATAPRPREL